MRLRETLVVFCLVAVTLPNLSGQSSPTQNPPAAPPQPAQQLQSSGNPAIDKDCDLDGTNNSLSKMTANDPAAASLTRLFQKCVKLETPIKGLYTKSPADYELQQAAQAAAQAQAQAQAAAAQAAPPTTPATQPSPGQQVTRSAWSSPDACATGTQGAAGAQGILFVHRALVWPKQASDDFGHRLGRRFIVYQVSVTNASTDFQYAVSDILVDLQPIFTAAGRYTNVLHAPTDAQSHDQVYEASSQDLSMLRGVPEKGQDYDPRNLTLHFLQGIGTVGAGVSGLTAFADVMGPAVANFNGALLQAFTGILPDHTSTQLNRLSDMAFTSNSLVGKLQTKKFAIFIPEELVMSQTEESDYWSNPNSLLQTLPLDQLNICVDGILLSQAPATADPTFSTNESKVNPNQTIALSDSTTGATIYYTTDGSNPTTTSSKYSAPIATGAAGTSPVTIKAFAFATNNLPSNTVVGVFTPTAAAASPTFACAADNKSLTITPATTGDTVYYTEDGTTPNRQSKSTTTPAIVTITGPSEKIEALEVGNNTSFSPVATQTCP
jgi:hypothetical protein